MADALKCYIRMLHAVVDAPALDLYINNELIATDFKYKDFSKYFDAEPGIYNIKIVPTSDSNSLVLSQNIEIENEAIYTLCIIGSLSMTSLELVADKKRDIDKSKAYIRYINLSPTESEFDFFMNGKLVTDNLKFREISGYLSFTPGQYNLTVKNSMTNKSVIVHPRLILSAAKQYSGFIVGIEQQQPPLEILIPLEGSTYINF